MPDNFLNFIKFGMGNAKSKRKGAQGRRKATPSFGKGGKNHNDDIGIIRDQDFLIDIHERWSEDPELKLIRRTIEIDPEMFVLNNLMMCVQFFENFDEEINNIRQTLVSSREAEVNARLPPQKHALIPDVLQQHVAQRVDFTYMLPTLKHTIELLQPIRIYVVFDNIEVTEESYASPYCSVNETITYSMQLKPSPGHKGYVQLQRLEVTPPKKIASADDVRLAPITSPTSDEIYSDGDSTYGNKLDKNVGGISRTKNDRDVKNVVGPMKDHRSRSQDNIFERGKGNRVEEDKEPGASMIDKKTPKSETSSTRKGTEGRSGRSRNPARQYGKAKHLGVANGSSPAGSTSSGYRSENYTDIESDYSYARTTYAGNTPKTSKSSLNDRDTVSTSMEIPRNCFKRMEFRADGKIYDARRERKQKMTLKEQLIWQAHQSRNYDVWYLNSTKFMKYFCHIFTEQLAIPMGFDPEINESAQGSVIYRNKVEVLEGTMSTKLETFEIVPCVSSQWPECAQEWLDRPRISWPRCGVIEKVKEFGCHMIPESPVNERPANKYQDLEWQLIFPAAERFLETCLTYPQVRVYLISLMLHKTFIRPVDSIFGLTTSHIKNRLFWMIEEDDRPMKWMENRTGEALMRLLNSLYRSISQDEPNLPDFFIKEKNLFQDKSYLLRTQKQLKRIIENPVMYVFHAMENIRHSRRFFPRLDYEELLRILMADTLTLVNPALAPQKTKSVGSSNNSEMDYDHVRGFWDDVKNRGNDSKTKTYLKKPVTNKSLINPRKAYDEVVEIPIRCASMEPRRLSSLLDFFVKHFMKMAECCHRYGAMPQKTAYIEQAERLSVLLLEHTSHKDAAKIYLEKLCSLKRREASTRSHSEPPKPPRRNPDMPVFTRPMKDRYQTSETEDANQALSRINDKTIIRNETENENNEDANQALSRINDKTIIRNKTENENNEDEIVIDDSSRSLTGVTIHDDNTEKSNVAELRSSGNVAKTEKPTERKNKSARIVSLSGKIEESYLTETTYI